MMQVKQQPELHAERLLLRPLTQDDAAKIQMMASDKRIAEMTANIPHPYPEGAAAAWISKHQSNWQQRRQVSYGIALLPQQDIIGAIGLVLRETNIAELGYWIGVDYWGNGYATEAVEQIIAFGFSTRSLKCVEATALSRNPASGRVLLKSGFVLSRTEEGSCGSKYESLDYYKIEARSKP